MKYGHFNVANVCNYLQQSRLQTAFSRGAFIFNGWALGRYGDFFFSDIRYPIFIIATAFSVSYYHEVMQPTQ